MDASLLLFIVNSVVGALLNVLMWAEKPEELRSWRAVRTVLIGCIAGYIYWWAHSEWSLPNGLVAIMAGYTAQDFIDWAMSKIPWKHREARA